MNQPTLQGYAWVSRVKNAITAKRIAVAIVPRTSVAGSKGSRFIFISPYLDSTHIDGLCTGKVSMIGMEKVDKKRHKTTGIVDSKQPGRAN